jgi:superfamily II DNA/RNA helicase
MEFDTLDLHASVAAGIKAAGFTIPTPIQAKAIPPALRRQH